MISSTERSINSKVQRDGAAQVLYLVQPIRQHVVSHLSLFPFTHWEGEGINESEKIAYVHVLTLTSKRPYENKAIAIKLSSRSWDTWELSFNLSALAKRPDSLIDILPIHTPFPESQ